MYFSNPSFIGIDPTAGRKPFTYAALDDDLHLTALGHGSLDEVLAFMAGQSQAVVAVCAPRKPSQGLMSLPQVRDHLSPPPRHGRWMDFRVVEYQLRQHHISCYKTPRVEKACPNWMKMGFTLYRRLERSGYHSYPARGHALQFLEVYPHASFCCLLGQAPVTKNTLEGRFQRQLVLHRQKMSVPDPMELIQGITPQLLLEGSWPDDRLYSPGELDALVAAFTAWRAIHNPAEITALGDDAEGLVILPVAELKHRY